LALLLTVSEGATVVGLLAAAVTAAVVQRTVA
jgi:hypothetical protein